MKSLEDRAEETKKKAWESFKELYEKELKDLTVSLASRSAFNAGWLKASAFWIGLDITDTEKDKAILNDKVVDDA